jgi:type IV secretory pathway VirB10-like protein
MDIDPQAIILLVFMVIAFLKFVGENLKAKNQQEEEPGDIEELYERTREEILDRQRSASPPSGETSPAGRKAPEQLSILDFFTPVSQPQPEPSLPSTPPPLPDETSAPPLPEREPVTSPTPKPSLSTAEAAALERIRQAKNQPTRSRRTIRRRPIRELLTSPAAARDAIILGEILGTPRGQQRSSGLTSLENR